MENSTRKVIEELQRTVVRMIATGPAGQGLSLIGGVRFRLLDKSPRMSMDVDYHWEGTLEDKQREVVAFLKKRVLPEVRRKFGYEGTAAPATGPAADSIFVKVIDQDFYKTNVPDSRIEIPLDITRIECLDKPIVRTQGGVVYLTVSDTDMIESKVLALINRTYVEARDMVDVFLFENFLAPQSMERMREKLTRLSVSRENIAERVEAIARTREVHLRNMREIITSQLDAETTSRLDEGGSAEAMWDRVIKILQALVAASP